MKVRLAGNRRVLPFAFLLSDVLVGAISVEGKQEHKIRQRLGLTIFTFTRIFSNKKLAAKIKRNEQGYISSDCTFLKLVGKSLDVSANSAFRYAHHLITVIVGVRIEAPIHESSSASEGATPTARIQEPGSSGNLLLNGGCADFSLFYLLQSAHQWRL